MLFELKLPYLTKRNKTECKQKLILPTILEHQQISVEEIKKKHDMNFRYLNYDLTLELRRYKDEINGTSDIPRNVFNSRQPAKIAVYQDDFT